MVTLAGLVFHIEPESSLTGAERAALQSLADPAPPEERTPAREALLPLASASARAPGPARLPAFRIVLDRGPAPRAVTTPAAAEVSWTGDLCLLDHAAFRAEIDPERREARIFRGDRSALGLVITLRMALACRLPFEGGVVLHAAGLEHEGKGVAFFGPSGAGKSTLARCSPWPILSDELVALVPDGGGGLGLCGTPFRRAPAGATPSFHRAPGLRALVELDKGPSLTLSRIGPAEALRRLLASAAVPAAPPVWSAALGVLGRLAREVPCYRMAWSPEDPPFARLASALGL